MAREMMTVARLLLYLPATTIHQRRRLVMQDIWSTFSVCTARRQLLVRERRREMINSCHVGGVLWAWKTWLAALHKVSKLFVLPGK
jgi:hypothetical protein